MFNRINQYLATLDMRLGQYDFTQVSDTLYRGQKVEAIRLLREATRSEDTQLIPDPYKDQDYGNNDFWNYLDNNNLLSVVVSSHVLGLKQAKEIVDILQIVQLMQK